MQFRLLMLFLLTSLSNSVLADVKVTVDKERLYLGQKLILTLETNQADPPRPNFLVLQENFNVVGTRKVTISSHTTGAVSKKTRWVLQIKPRQSGSVQVPEIQIGDQPSQPIAITVLPANSNPELAEETGRTLFLETSLDKDELLVNAETVLRAKLFHLAPLPLDANLTAPESPDILIKPLEEQKQYTALVRGQNYNVTETSYALFPLQEGVIDIAPLFFTATLPSNTLIELESEPLALAVRAPAFTNNRNIWLPAKSIYLEDNLALQNEVRQQESLRRVIKLEAEGLPASALPSIARLTNPAASIQLLNVVLEERMTEQGIISQRIEELNITPNNEAQIVLSPIDLPWWNIQAERGQTATLAARTINVLPEAVITLKQPEIKQTSPQSNLLIWILTAITIAATLGFIYTFHHLRKVKQRNEADVEEFDIPFEPPIVTEELNESRAFEAFALACEQNNPRTAQQQLINWAQNLWPEEEIKTLETVCECMDNQTINFLVMDLQQYLYELQDDFWRGDLLLDAITKVRAKQLQRKLDLQLGANYLSYNN